jgi:hypothetical protein
MLLFPFLGVAQNRVGMLPQVNLSEKYNKGFKLNTKLESRSFFYENSSADYRFDRVDFAVYGNQKTGVLSSVAFGYMIRYQNDDWFHRFTQQYSVNQNFGSLKMNHRFRLDQTFEVHTGSRYRARYRLSSVIPFAGQNIDDKEFYLKVSDEPVLSLAKGKYRFENRVLLNLGYNISDNQKLETGVETRISNTTMLLWNLSLYLGI